MISKSKIIALITTLLILCSILLTGCNSETACNCQNIEACQCTQQTVCQCDSSAFCNCEDNADSNTNAENTSTSESNKIQLLPLILEKAEVHHNYTPTGPYFSGDRNFVWLYYENQNPFTVYGYINVEIDGQTAKLQTWPIQNGAEDTYMVAFKSGSGYIYAPVEDIGMKFNVVKVAAYPKELDNKLFEDSDPSNTIMYDKGGVIEH